MFINYIEIALRRHTECKLNTSLHLLELASVSYSHLETWPILQPGYSFNKFHADRYSIKQANTLSRYTADSCPTPAPVVLSQSSYPVQHDDPIRIKKVRRATPKPAKTPHKGIITPIKLYYVFELLKNSF
ncbi:MAG: hypothetical protein ABI416_11865 [Ginsengibacter sp.]